MGTASRKTWLEKQSDEVQFDVLNWDESGAMTLEQIAARVKSEHGVEVPVTTLHHSLQALHRDGGVRLVKMMARFFKQNPEADSHLLSRAYVLSQAASEEFRKAKLKPEEIVEAAQTDKRLSIQDRQAAAIEERNRLKQQELELNRRRVELMERKLPKVKEQLEDVVKDEKADASELKRRIREIYGLIDEPAQGGAAGSALPAPMDR